VIFFPLDFLAQQPATDNSPPTPADPGANANDNQARSDQKLSGVAQVVKVTSIDGDPVFHADGYRVHVRPATVTAFSGDLKTLGDVSPGTWLRFEGSRDDTGMLVARKAEFFPSGSRTRLTAMGPRKLKHAPDYQPITRDALLDASGNFVPSRTKVRLSDAGGPCGWHRVPADRGLQERIENIGTRLVPQFQKQLPLDSPARIPFRFYVVADDRVRSVFACNAGLILVPKNVVERLQNDDQIAAVLADGVAFNLKRQLFTISSLDFLALGSEAVFWIPPFPAGYVAGELTEGLIGHEVELRLQREIGRISLQLTADAGFDPWQAPEAWRILAPKDVPQNVQSIKYTNEGRYQLEILKLQYQRNALAAPAASPATALAAPAK
jgi:hypothetical protein